jgi:LysM repeat protein
MPPVELDPQHAPETVPPVLPPRRNPPRDWAAPPPWTGDPADAPGAAGLAAAGYAAEYEAPFDDDPGSDGAEPSQAAGAPVAPAAPATDGWGTEARGLAGSAAYLLAGPDPDEPLPATPAPADPYEYPPVAARQNPAPQPPRQPSGSRPPSAKGSGKGSGRPVQATPQSSPPPAGTRQDASELFGPAWERPRRYEAYPTLRTRIGLPSLGGIPKVGIAGLALVLAALFLFFFGPMILGFGSKDPGVGAGVTPRPTVAVTATPEPTTAPAPTPRTYTVARGDTISKIAAKFHVTPEALLAANPQIKNPDKIKIGDKITIPVAVEGAGAGAGSGTVAGSTPP